MMSGLKVDLRSIRGGAFNQACPASTTQVRQVNVGDFWLCSKPVTTKLLTKLFELTGQVLANLIVGKPDDMPIGDVNWYEAVKVCNLFSDLDGFSPVYLIKKNSTDGADIEVEANWDANGYRLPTEAEWEYAARGGPKTQGFQYSGSDILSDIGWYEDNATAAEPVAQKAPNELGLFDMSGNVWEWCWDWHGDFQVGNITDPHGPSEGEYKIIRGGSWGDSAKYCTSINRNWADPSIKDLAFGLRLARNA